MVEVIQEVKLFNPFDRDERVLAISVEDINLLKSEPQEPIILVLVTIETGEPK
jgi:hypothetical protein